MKKLILSLLICFASLQIFAQTSVIKITTSEPIIGSTTAQGILEISEIYFNNETRDLQLAVKYWANQSDFLANKAAIQLGSLKNRYDYNIPLNSNTANMSFSDCIDLILQELTDQGVSATIITLQ